MSIRRAAALGMVALLVPAVALAANAGTPLKGSDGGGFTLGASCAANSSVVDIRGEGNASQLGRYSYVARECFNTSTLAYTGTFAMTAANGDELRGSYAGVVYPIGTTSSARYLQAGNFTGGTGRFAGATGTLTIDGVATFTSSSGGDYTQVVSATIEKG